MTDFPEKDLSELDAAERFLPEQPSRRLAPNAATGTFRSWSVNAPPQHVECGDGVTKYGQRFVWTAEHLTADQLAPLRLRGDLLMDAALPAGEGGDCLAQLDAAALADPSGAAAELLRHASSPPEWVDWELLALGQAVYRRYLPLASVVLYHLSLVGGFSAPKISKVLSSTGYLTAAPPAVMQRLLETGRMLIDCCTASDALRPRGVGWSSALRVRALHARVRRRLLRSKWDTNEWGVPINQEDLAVTLLAFSTNVINGCEIILGSAWPAQEQSAYLHLWRYVGWLLGVADDCNPCAGSVGRAQATTVGRAQTYLHWHHS